VKAIFLSAIALCAIGGEASACVMPSGRYIHGQANTTQMTVASGKSCGALSNSLGPTTNRAVLRKPAHGRVLPYAFGMSYRSVAGYTGPDSFSFRVQGRKAHDNTPYDYTVTVQVTVTP
jgi:hypothetical protein